MDKDKINPGEGTDMLAVKKENFTKELAPVNDAKRKALIQGAAKTVFDKYAKTFEKLSKK